MNNLSYDRWNIWDKNCIDSIKIEEQRLLGLERVWIREWE